MNTFDWIVIGVSAIGAVSGTLKGFIEEFTQKTGYIAGILFALMFTKKLLPTVEEMLGIPLWLCSLLTYITVFITAFLLVKVLGNVLRSITDNIGLTWLDKAMGFLLGLLETFIVVSFLFRLLTFQNLFTVYGIENSYIYSTFILPLCERVATFIKELF